MNFARLHCVGDDRRAVLRRVKKRVIIYPLLGTVVGFAASRSISWCFPSFVTFMLFHFPKEASTDVAHVDGGSCTESMAIFFRRNDSIG